MGLFEKFDKLAEVASEVYNNWEQDEEGDSEGYVMWWHRIWPIQPSSFNINDRYLDYENFFNDSGESLDF